ncbi:MAG: hypothetical protein RL614_861, partial [Pseudomonadota bacterium]
AAKPNKAPTWASNIHGVFPFKILMTNKFIDLAGVVALENHYAER